MVGQEETNREEFLQKSHLKGFIGPKALVYNLQKVDRTSGLKQAESVGKGTIMLGFRERPEGPEGMETGCLVEYKDLADIHALH